MASLFLPVRERVRAAVRHPVARVAAAVGQRLLDPPFSLILVTLALLAVVHGTVSAVRHGVVGTRGARVYYDAYHGARHLWNRHNHRHHHAYHTVSGYGRFHDALTEAGFDIDVATSHGFDRATLDDYDVFFVGEQTNHARFMTDQEIEDLRDWIEDGGGLYVMSEHSNAFYMADVFNRLAEGLPVKARRDTIDDRDQTPPPFSSDWPILSAAEENPHPVAEGIREYMHFAGCSFDTPHGALFSGPTSWADYYTASKPPIFNGDTRRQTDEIGGPVAGVVAFDHGEGRVVAAGDHNAFSNPNFYWGDHYKFGLQAIGWLAGQRLNRDVFLALAGMFVLLLYWRRNRSQRVKALRTLALGLVTAGIVAGAWYGSRPGYRDILIYRGNAPAMNLMTKNTAGYYAFNGILTKERDLRPWASPRLVPGHDALVLAAPTTPLSPEDLATVDGYLVDGKSVLYMANSKSLRSPAGEQLQEHFGFKIELGPAVELAKGEKRSPYLIHGPPDMLAGIFRFWVRAKTPRAQVEGLEPVISLTPGSLHIEDEAWTDEEPIIHLLSERKLGRGTLMVLTPAELFDSASMGKLYDINDLIQEQMAELVLRIVARMTGG